MKHIRLHLWIPILIGWVLLIGVGTERLCAQDRIYLKDGRLLSGLLVEEIPTLSLIRLQLPDSSFEVLDLKDVFQIFRGPVQDGYWDRVTLKAGAEIYGFIRFYQAGREIRMEVPGNRKTLAVFRYLEIDKIEKIPVDEAEGLRQNRLLLREQKRAERVPRSMRYLGEYGFMLWGEHAEVRWNITTSQLLLFDFSPRYSLGMGLGFDLNPNIGNTSLLAGNSVLGANRFYFPGAGITPYLLTDLGYDFIRDGFLMNVGGGLRVPAGKTHINFNLSLRLQQTDILGNARNTLSVPDPPKLLEILQFKVVLE